MTVRELTALLSTENPDSEVICSLAGVPKQEEVEFTVDDVLRKANFVQLICDTL